MDAQQEGCFTAVSLTVESYNHIHTFTQLNTRKHILQLIKSKQNLENDVIRSRSFVCPLKF